MHIHGNHMNMNSANLSALAGANQAAAAQRAADVRKKLLKYATSAATDAEPGSAPGSSEETVWVGRWMEETPSQTLPGDEYHAGGSGKDLGLV